jgi:hypothetical protein
MIATTSPTGTVREEDRTLVEYPCKITQGLRRFPIPGQQLVDYYIHDDERKRSFHTHL